MEPCGTIVWSVVRDRFRKEYVETRVFSRSLGFLRAYISGKCSNAFCTRSNRSRAAR
jgi:hypothetical protein